MIQHPYELRIQADKRGRFPKIWVTSDTHYNHKNICYGTTGWLDENGNKISEGTRPFALLEDMNNTIVEGINSKVGPDDILIFLGDVAFGGPEFVHQFLNRLTCQNFILVYGNHDEFIAENDQNLQERFISCHNYLKLCIGKKRFILSHYPIVSWHGMNKGWFHCFGHVHLPGHKKFGPGRCMDVGVDGNNYIPYNLVDEVVPLLDQRPVKSWFGGSPLHADHHEKDRIKKMRDGKNKNK